MRKIEIKPPIKIKLLQDFPPFRIDYICLGEKGDKDGFIIGIGGSFKNPHPEDELTVTSTVTFIEDKKGGAV